MNQNPPVVNCASINAQRERGERNRRRLESSPADRRTSGAPCPCPVPSLFLSPQSRSAPVDDLSWLLHWEWTRFSAPCSIGSLYIVSKAVNQVTHKVERPPIAAPEFGAPSFDRFALIMCSVIKPKVG